MSNELHPDPEIAAEVQSEIDAAHAYECRYCRPGSGYSPRIPSSVSSRYVHARGPEGSPQRVVCNSFVGEDGPAPADWSAHPGGEAFVFVPAAQGEAVKL